MSDLDAILAWAENTGTRDAGKLNITGFCRGERIVWMYATHNRTSRPEPPSTAGLSMIRSLYSRSIPSTSRSSFKVPVLGLYGGADQGIPLDTVDQMRAALRAAGTRPRPSFTRRLRMASTRTAGRATANRRRRMAGSASRSGSRSMEPPDLQYLTGSCGPAARISHATPPGPPSHRISVTDGSAWR